MDDNTTAAETIARHLQLLSGMSGSAALARILLEHGRTWEASDLPADLPRGALRECFANSQRHVLTSGSEYTYVEGLACPASLPFHLPIIHGWLVDRAGRVVDMTWDRPGESYYFGVAFRESYVLDRVMATRLYNSLLDSPEDRFLLLRGAVPVADWLGSHTATTQGDAHVG